jgi:hypothetical protein
MATPATTRLIVGRRIVALDQQPYDGGRGRIAHYFLLTLDNGARLRGVVDETETGEYGVELIYDPPKKAPRRAR